MPELKNKSAKNKRAKGREFVFTQSEQKLLRKVGLHIQNDLYKKDKSLEWLAVEIGFDLPQF